VETIKSKGTFCTTLCVLAWAFLAVQFVLAFASLFSLHTMPESLKNINPDDFEPVFYSGIALYVKNVQNYGYLLYSLYIGSSLVTSFAVWMMWDQKKYGYYIFLLSSLIPPVASFLIHSGGMLMVMVTISGNFILVVVFNVFFVLCQKRLRSSKE
jgi:hypothetical protein